MINKEIGKAKLNKRSLFASTHDSYISINGKTNNSHIQYISKILSRGNFSRCSNLPPSEYRVTLDN